MKVVSVDKGQITVSFSEDEYAFLSSAINEALEIVDEKEFFTRTGFETNAAQELLDSINESIDLIPE